MNTSFSSSGWRVQTVPANILFFLICPYIFSQMIQLVVMLDLTVLDMKDVVGTKEKILENKLSCLPYIVDFFTDIQS